MPLFGLSSGRRRNNLLLLLSCALVSIAGIMNVLGTNLEGRRLGAPSSLREEYMCGGTIRLTADELEFGCSNQTSSDSKNYTMGAVVQVFNHAPQASLVLKGLESQRAMKHILVMDDGSSDGSFEAYQSAAGNQTRVFRMGNVHEVRNYNRGLELLKEDVDFYTLMQDDDVLNGQDEWVEHALDIYRRFPRLCVLGGWIGWDHMRGGSLKPPEYYGNEKPNYYTPIREKTNRTCGEHEFRFVLGVASSPMILRKECVNELGPLSTMYTEPGEPGILFDIEYSLRAWKHGWQVGLYRTEFHHGVGGHSTRKTRELRARVAKANQKGIQWLREHYGQLHCTYRHETANTTTTAGSKTTSSSIKTT